jgi:CRISPR-associated endonuclease Csy4
MHHYLDITLQDDHAFPKHQLMDALFARLHRKLAHVQATTIGVSFPEYSITPITLGSTLRLLGPNDDLSYFSNAAWLLGLREHATLTALTPVPVTAESRALRRVQAKSSPERILRRQMRRHSLTESEVRAKYADLRPEQLRLPFVTLASRSTGQPFKLFLKLGSAESTDHGARFNSYGLSQTASIPWF